jgi:hypothetical protein
MIEGSNGLWPNGKPTRSELLPDGRTVHTLEDGRQLMVPIKAVYVMHYLPTCVDAAPNETYPVNIALAGLSSIDQGFYEVWNFDIGEVRNYLFARTVRVTHIDTGEVYSREEFERALRSAVADRQQREHEESRCDESHLDELDDVYYRDDHRRH